MDMHFHGVIFQTHSAELHRRLSRSHPPFLIVDVRPRSVWERQRIAGAVPLSPDELEQGLPKGTGPETEFFVVGKAPGDPQVRRATDALRRHGARRCVELGGGMLEWRQLGFPVEQGERQAA